MVVVPAQLVVKALDQCGKRGVKHAIIVSGGFRETGPEGQAREVELSQVAEKHGIRARVQRKMEELSGRAEELINGISAREEYRKVLLDVLRYNIERKR